MTMNHWTVLQELNSGMETGILTLQVLLFLASLINTLATYVTLSNYSGTDYRTLHGNPIILPGKELPNCKDEEHW